MIAFPPWFTGGFPDRELVVVDLLQPFLDMLDIPDAAVPPLATTWLPDNWQERLPAPLVRVYRTGGEIDETTKRDHAFIQLGVIGETRTDSWAVIEYCQELMLSYADGGTVYRRGGGSTLVDSIEQMSGPQLIPELNPDNRLVPMTFRVSCRRPKGLPNYRVLRESMSDSLSTP